VLKKGKNCRRKSLKGGVKGKVPTERSVMVPTFVLKPYLTIAGSLLPCGGT